MSPLGYFYKSFNKSRLNPRIIAS